MNILGRVVHPPNTVQPTPFDGHPADKHLAVDNEGFLQLSPESTGYDQTEQIWKVGVYVWDVDLMEWVRASSLGGGGGGGTLTIAPKTKLFDRASSTVLYAGEAAPGSASSAAAWRIRKLIFDAAGDVLSITYAAVGASTAIWDNRASLSYS